MTAPKFYKATLSAEKCAQIGRTTMQDVGALFDELGARDWTIGEEVGKDTGYKHYQCHIEFKKPKDWASLKKVFAGIGDIRPACAKDDHYEVKDGKYIKKREGPLAKYRDITLLPWQYSIVGDLAEQGERQITVLIDEEGNHGKTWLTKYLEANHILDVCPVLSNNAQEYIAYCMEFQHSGYVFDFPRADSIKDKYGLWKAVERIKDGILYDGRYHPRKAFIDPPKILIFTNETEIPLDILTKDRWRIWTLDDTFGELNIRQIAYEE